MRDYKKELEELQSFYDKKSGELEQIKKDKDKIEEEQINLQKQYEKLLIEKRLIDKSCEQARLDGKQAIEELSNYFLEAVFDEETRMFLNLGSKDGIPTTEVELKTFKNGEEVTIIPELDGGGINDILSSGIFCSLNIINSEQNKGIIVLDEPSKNISKGVYADRFAEYFKTLLHEVGKQVVISTHDESLAEIGDGKFFLEKNDHTGISKVIKEK